MLTDSRPDSELNLGPSRIVPHHAVRRQAAYRRRGDLQPGGCGPFAAFPGSLCPRVREHDDPRVWGQALALPRPSVLRRRPAAKTPPRPRLRLEGGKRLSRH
jgi:hypothetical protein